MKSINFSRKKKKNTITIIYLSLAVLLFLVITGCGGGFFKGRTDTIETYDFRKGTDGVAMKFVEDMPPKQVFIGSEFSTGLKLKNMGAFDVEQTRAFVELSVPDMSVLSFEKSHKEPFALNGKSLYIKEGDEDLLLFPMKALCFPGYEDRTVRNYTRKMRAAACYYYETTANADLCIDTRKFQRQPHEKPECQMKELILSGGQGGPVGVTKISPTILQSSENQITAQLRVSINKLKGADHTIYDPDTGCVVQGQNFVEIEVELGGKQLVCKPSEVKLKAKEAVGAVCELKLDSSLGAYLTPIVVKMKYYVKQSLLKEITIEPPPGIERGKEKEFCAGLKGGSS
jgi:hypothetical protein